MVDSGASVHMMSKSDLIQSERVLCDYCTEWNNYYDRRSHCLCQGFGHVSSRPVVGRLTCRALARIFCSAIKYSCGRKDSRSHKPNMTTSSIASRKVLCQWSYAECLLIQVPEAMQRQHRETERRQLRDREQDIPVWLQPFTEGLVEGASGSSSSAGETIPKKHLLHTLQRDPRTNLARAPCRRNVASREGRITQTMKFGDRITADHEEIYMQRTNRDCVLDMW